MVSFVGNPDCIKSRIDYEWFNNRKYPNRKNSHKFHIHPKNTQLIVRQKNLDCKISINHKLRYKFQSIYFQI